MEMRKLVIKEDTRGIKRKLGNLVCVLVNNKHLVLDLLGALFFAIMTYICLVIVFLK